MIPKQGMTEKEAIAYGILSEANKLSMSFSVPLHEQMRLRKKGTLKAVA